MWRLAGDTSTDFNHYTKRMTLGRGLWLDPARLARRPERKLERHRRLPRPPDRRRDAVREVQGRVARVGRSAAEPVALPRPAALPAALERLLIIIRMKATPRPCCVAILLSLALALRLRPRAAQRRRADVQTTWQLLDYLAVDYGGAVQRRKGRSAHPNMPKCANSRLGRGQDRGASGQVPPRPQLVAESKQLQGADRAQGQPPKDVAARRARAGPASARRLSGAARAPQAPDPARGAQLFQAELRQLPWRQGRRADGRWRAS